MRFKTVKRPHRDVRKHYSFAHELAIATAFGAPVAWPWRQCWIDCHGKSRKRRSRDMRVVMNLETNEWRVLDRECVRRWWKREFNIHEGPGLHHICEAEAQRLNNLHWGTT